MVLQRSRSPRVRREPVDATVARLKTFIDRMERRYECSSEVMAAEVASGKARDTAEVARWLSDYRTLRFLTGSGGQETPTGTTTTS